MLLCMLHILIILLFAFIVAYLLIFVKSILPYKEKVISAFVLMTFSNLVPLTGLEPVRILLRGILSPLCLPIQPQRQHYYYTTEYQPSQAFFQKNSGRNIHHLLSQSSCGTILFSKVPKYAILISRSNEQGVFEMKSTRKGTSHINMLEGPLIKSILLFALPIAASSIL